MGITINLVKSIMKNADDMLGEGYDGSKLECPKAAREMMTTRLNDAKRETRMMRKMKQETMRSVNLRFGRGNKKTMKSMNEAARKAKEVRKEVRSNHKKKIKHLQMKIREMKPPKPPYEVPIKIREYDGFSAYSNEEEEDIRSQHDVPLQNILAIDCTISDDERRLLSLPPKFCLFSDLKGDDFDLATELANTKIRYFKRDSDEDREAGDPQDEPADLQLTPEQQLQSDREEARTRQVYDHQTKELDVGRLRATDVKGNARVHLPGPLPTSQEAQLHIRTQAFKETFNNYIKKSAPGGKQRTNLTVAQTRGLKSLKKRITEGEVVVCQTDKTGLFCVVSTQAYIKMGEPHVAGDKEVKQEEIEKIQRLTNGHTSSWIKILGAGSQWDHASRIRETCINHGANVGPMYLLVKDHKQVEEGEVPKTRPVVASQGGLNYHLQNLLSEVIEPIAEEVHGGIEVSSTEDLMAKLDTINSKLDKDPKMQEKLEDMMILASDAVALFPSLRKEETATTVFEEVVRSRVQVEGLSWKESARYVKINSEPWEAQRFRVSHLLPRRRYTRGPAPGMTSSDVLTGKQDSDTQWIFPDITPTAADERRLLAAALALAVRFIFSTHMYTFGGRVYLQSDGGPIGLRLTCALAKLRMAVFARTLKQILSTNHIEVSMAASYVDDFRFLVQMLDQGTRWDGERLVWNPLWEEEDIASGESRERITATELCRVMNSICKDVKMTVEVEEDFSDRFIPTLDMQMKLDKDLGRVVYKFYSKPMSSALCLVEKSALPITIRNATLTQEVLRRQLNCSRDVNTKERMEIMESFTSKMTKSGYSKSQMRDALTAGLVGYANRVEREEKLGIPVHKEGASGKPLRRLDRLTAKSTWFKRPRVEQELPESPTKRRRTGPQTRKEAGPECPSNTPDTVMFVPKTRGGH